MTRSALTPLFSREAPPASLDSKNHFEYAQKHKCAICAFNVSNLETMQAVTEAAKELKAPIIISASEGAIEYAGVENLVCLAANLTRGTSVPMALHLDHGKSYEMCKKCIDAGFSSVMIDGSALPFEENISLTKKVVTYAHKHGVSVEGELGQIVGIEDNVKAASNILTNPADAKVFVNKTGCDSLAISIGTAHGINKGTITPQIHYETIEAVSRALGKKYPLVAHGSSAVPQNMVVNINHFGGEITKSQGIDYTDLVKMSQTSICKINIDTDLRLCFTSAIRQFLYENRGVFDPRKILSSAKAQTKDYAKYLINMLTIKK